MNKISSAKIAENRAAKFHYEILATFEAGVILSGAETKSCRMNKPNLKSAFISLDKNEEAWLKNCDIPEYRLARGQPHERKRDRKLLLSKKELAKVARYLNEKGVTAVPLDLHLRGPRIKVSLAIGKGKRKWEKRETLKKRDLDRESRRSFKH